jgi:hypothetical protein
MGNLSGDLTKRPDLPMACFGIVHLLADLDHELNPPILEDDTIDLQTVTDFSIIKITTPADQLIDNHRLQHFAAVSWGKTTGHGGQSGIDGMSARA